MIANLTVDSADEGVLVGESEFESYGANAMPVNRGKHGVLALAMLGIIVGVAWTSPALADCSASPAEERFLDGTLHVASANGEIEILEALLNAGANPDVFNTSGFAALHVAAATGHVASVEALLNAGAKPSIVNAAPTEHYARANFKRCAGYTPLHFAAWRGTVESVDALIAAGGKVDAAGDDGTTPIALADQFGHVDVVLSLLNAGATHR